MKRKNKNNNEEEHLKIKDYYTKALTALESDEPANGGKIILNDMPARLYDMALDIDENKNAEFSDQELRTLIKKVNNMLDNFSQSHFNDDEISDADIDLASFEVKDYFPNKTF